MNSREIKKNASAFTIVSGIGGLLGLTLVAFAVAQIIGRLWEHLETRLWAVPGLAPVVVVAVGALLITACLFGLSRRRVSGAAAEAGR
jgi:hypothetical protein